MKVAGKYQLRACRLLPLKLFPLVLSAPEGIRTPNLLIRSQMLYPLSYGRLVVHIQLYGGGERI